MKASAPEQQPRFKVPEAASSPHSGSVAGPPAGIVSQTMMGANLGHNGRVD